jgi:hypothetical protein
MSSPCCSDTILSMSGPVSVLHSSSGSSISSSSVFPLIYELISSKLYSWLNFLIFLIVLTMRTDLQSNDSVSSIVFSFFMHSFIICFFSSLCRSLGIPCSLGGPWFMNNFVLAIVSITLVSGITCYDNITISLVRPFVFPLLLSPSNWQSSSYNLYNLGEDS